VRLGRPLHGAAPRRRARLERSPSNAALRAAASGARSSTTSTVPTSQAAADDRLDCNLGVRRGGTALKRGRRSTEVGVCLGVEETLACRAAEGGVHRALASAPGDHRGLRAAQLRYRAASASSSPRSIRSSSRPRPPRACHEHGPARGRPGGRPEARRPGRRPGRTGACARQRRALTTGGRDAGRRRRRRG
jgi:hypothetical protein